MTHGSIAPVGALALIGGVDGMTLGITAMPVGMIHGMIPGTTAMVIMDGDALIMAIMVGDTRTMEVATAGDIPTIGAADISFVIAQEQKDIPERVPGKDQEGTSAMAVAGSIPVELIPTAGAATAIARLADGRELPLGAQTTPLIAPLAAHALILLQSRVALLPIREVSEAVASEEVSPVEALVAAAMEAVVAVAILVTDEGKKQYSTS